MVLKNLVYILEAKDFENEERIKASKLLHVFKRGTNFPLTVTCVIGAKVMFLTNSMLANKGISNSSIGIIMEVLDDRNVKATFPTKDSIQVCLLYYIFSI
jgi:hypothetical protein